MPRSNAGVVPPDSFLEYLDEMLRQRGWSYYRLTQEAKFKSTSYISQLRKGKKIGYGTAAAIADALGVSRAEIYIRTGLDQAPAGLRLVIETWSKLTDEEVTEATRLAERASKRTSIREGRPSVGKDDAKRKR
jgi:transcriptional regulator with XRE-family HTH domain